jgi:YfiH family protein
MDENRDECGVSLWRFDRLSAERSISHFVAGRHGGVSAKPYDSLNLGLHTADDRSNVLRNRELLFAAAGVTDQQIASCSQVHGDEVIVVDRPTQEPPRGDAVTTNVPGIMLFLLMADCVPVLVFDPVQLAVGIAHAGWRGTALRIGERLITRMTDEFGCVPGDMVAAIGPSIGPCCYEVGDDVIACVRNSLPQPEALLRMYPSGRKARFDLWLANRQQMFSMGIPAGQIEDAALCTKCHANDFFSDRAARPGGRFGAGIMLLPAV